MTHRSLCAEEPSGRRREKFSRDLLIGPTSLFCYQSLPLPLFLPYAKDAATLRIPSKAPRGLLGQLIADNIGILSSPTRLLSTTDYTGHYCLEDPAVMITKATDKAVTGEYVCLLPYRHFSRNVSDFSIQLCWKKGRQRKTFHIKGLFCSHRTVMHSQP